MLKKSALVAGLVMLGALAGPQASTAASLLPPSGSSLGADASLVQRADWRDRRYYGRWDRHDHCHWVWSRWRGWHCRYW